ncbi:MAG: hypothetical protein COB37_00430 [Kordiimonadales bacterium]|nr:MAG: hypothetical protein COB37_00430 [Kordiimonadales bacterium]
MVLILKMICVAASLLAFTAPIKALSSSALQAEPIIEVPVKVLLKNFYYLDPASGMMVRGDFMLIENGIISSVNLSQGLCAGCTIIDLEGGYLIPGLMDLHQHLNVGGFAKKSTEQLIGLLRRNFYWGITTVYNPGIQLPLLRAIRKATRRNPGWYPEVYAAGQSIDTPGGWNDRGAPSKPVGATASDLQEFKTVATRQLAASADFINVSSDDMSWLTSTPMAQFPPLLLQQGVALMRANKRRLFVHVAQKNDVQAALAAGVDAVISGTIDGLIDDPAIRFFTAKQTGYISTLALYETIANPQKSVAAQKYFDPDFVNSRHIYSNMGSDFMAQNWRDWWDRAEILSSKIPTLRGNTLALIKAGALVGIGTDAGTPSVIFGASLAYEMQLHEQLGLAPLAIIQMASLNNAKILKISHRTGSIAPGREADLVLLTQNPTSGIKAINSLVWTMQNGEITYRRELTAPGSR